MITNNYKKILKAFMGVVYGTTYKTGSLDPLKSVDDTDIDMLSSNFSMTNVINTLTMTYSRSSKSGAGFTFGTGTTAPTGNDIDMESPLYATQSTFTMGTFMGVNLVKQGTKNIVEYQMTLVNKTNSPITINEIGLVVQSSGGSPSVKNLILIDRTVIDEPIVLPVGNTPVPIKYTMEFDWDI